MLNKKLLLCCRCCIHQEYEWCTQVNCV